MDHGGNRRHKIVGIMQGKEGEKQTEEAVNRENKRFEEDGEIDGPSQCRRGRAGGAGAPLSCLIESGPVSLNLVRFADLSH
jgi:hypothetical protein